MSKVNKFVTRKSEAGDVRPLSLQEALAGGRRKPPLLKINDRIVWLSEAGVEYGSVKWIGILPDIQPDWMIGVAFDNPVGTGTGLYKDHQLFTTKLNHASLVPAIGLLKAIDFDPPSTSIPPTAPAMEIDLSRQSTDRPSNTETLFFPD